MKLGFVEEGAAQRAKNDRSCNILQNDVDTVISHVARSYNVTRSRVKRMLCINTNFEYNLYILQVTTPISNIFIPQKTNDLFKCEALKKSKATVTEQNIHCFSISRNETYDLISDIIQIIIT